MPPTRACELNGSDYRAVPAVNDALAPLGVRVTELPMTPDRLRAAIRAAGGGSAAR